MEYKDTQKDDNIEINVKSHFCSYYGPLATNVTSPKKKRKMMVYF